MNHRTINVYEKDEEEIVKELYSVLKNTVFNIFIFVLCIFLFLNPFLLSNVLLFISIFMLVKVSLNAIFSYSTTLIQDLKEKDESLVNRLLKENKILKSKINLQKEEKFYPFSKKRKSSFSFSNDPFGFNFKLDDKNKIKEDDVKEDDVKEDDVKEDDVKEDDVKEDDVNEDDVNEDDVKEEDVKEDDVKEYYENDFEEDIKEDDNDYESYSILEKEN